MLFTPYRLYHKPPLCGGILLAAVSPLARKLGSACRFAFWPSGLFYELDSSRFLLTTKRKAS